MNIKSASDLLGISADTIRYYERVGLVPPITRTATGIRDFQDQDIEALEFIKCFRSACVSVDSLVDYMSLYQKGDETREERLGILEEEKQKLEDRLSQLQTALNRLNLKIKLYKEGKF
ncbi:TPA: MerR family transcriptional regulator [Streptococcus pneumoniae]|uniref:stress response transcriptional regulator NmlR n=1 Tax=Streptococcus pneumoniae TaxID=1313 RepID=UPI0005E4250A|nr:stress response transcriptional regulator NmlR [Streptococcus pneumoniae]CTO13666.1 MerR family regulatory protein [Streptococcus pneumoniae]VJW20335.1 MerR family transcriptional regulator [Streptococcus pneumoniae]VJY71070.1 MerR family transcriptional regulator [Streptococcus pneumoniae]VKE89161.1 MerR family transcriptional regulator [Streptococcus pneumoniae]VKO07695.1 MerR family transcriptional regulator [Streptococcus pneumoniae]